MSDARDLLSAIRQGFQLRRLRSMEQEKQDVVGNNVATILSRRLLWSSSSEDDSSEFDEDEWSD